MGDTTQGVHGQKDKEPSYKEQLVLVRITGSDTLRQVFQQGLLGVLIPR